MRVNPLTGGTSFGGRDGRKARRKQAIKSKKIGDRLLGTRRFVRLGQTTMRLKHLSACFHNSDILSYLDL